MNYLDEAYKEAEKALKKQEIPIGAVIVKNGKIISRAHNQREGKQNALHHAEILAINKACKKLKSWRLTDAEMYVTLEPCPMCAGAILNARIKKVVIGCLDKDNGAMVSKYTMATDNVLNHSLEVETIEDIKCKNILTQFFKNIRKRK